MYLIIIIIVQTLSLSLSKTLQIGVVRNDEKISLGVMFLNLGVVSPLSSPFGVTALLLLLLLLFILLTFFGDANDDPSLLPLVLVSPIFGGVSSISNFIFCPTFTGAFNASFIHFCMLTGLLRAVPASVVVFVVVFSSSGVVVAACRDPSSLVKYVAIGVAYPLPVVSFLFLFDSDLLVVVVVVFFFFRFSTFGVECTLDIRPFRPPLCCCFFPLLSVVSLVFFVFSFGVFNITSSSSTSSQSSNAFSEK